ncbi:DNA repair protein RecO C-terminal domain-containing protein [Bacillus sp. FSL W8-0223]|uniref:DNA repair protein RecO C-terminal domain-containing protein n=1 Tax=Bacillus sp. FSL W8-0223 TaxID=2954595 RepID=UPI0030F9C43E
MNREYLHGLELDDCPNCGKPNSATRGSSRWGHDYLCCSEACGIRLGQKIDAGMIDLPRYQYGPFGVLMNDYKLQIQNLRKRIKELEGQLKENNIKPMKSRI